MISSRGSRASGVPRLLPMAGIVSQSARAGGLDRRVHAVDQLAGVPRLARFIIRHVVDRFSATARAMWPAP